MYHIYDISVFSTSLFFFITSFYFCFLFLTHISSLTSLSLSFHFNKSRFLHLYSSCFLYLIGSFVSPGRSFTVHIKFWQSSNRPQGMFANHFNHEVYDLFWHSISLFHPAEALVESVYLGYVCLALIMLLGIYMYTPVRMHTI